MNFESEETLDAFIDAFEAGVWPIGDWKHAHHLAMAACYVYTYGRDEALQRARTNIQKYNVAQGGKNTEDAGYHETLTVFWIDIVADALPQGKSRLDCVHEVTRSLAPQRDLWREYYTFDVVKSREARKQWLPPDRSPDLTRSR